jgi:hypothetical protein
MSDTEKLVPDPYFLVKMLQVVASKRWVTPELPRRIASEVLPHAEAIAEELTEYRTLDRDDFAVQELVAAAREHACIPYEKDERLRAALKPFEEER